VTVEIEVPLNSSANVSLAGQNSGPIEVGSGRHHWSYPYQLPEVTYPPLTLDSTLGELIDSPEAYALVLSIIPQHYPVFMARMQARAEVTLRHAIYSNPRTEKLGPQIDASLASLGQ
jgi:hypothetical protein